MNNIYYTKLVERLCDTRVKRKYVNELTLHSNENEGYDNWEMLIRIKLLLTLIRCTFLLEYDCMPTYLLSLVPIVVLRLAGSGSPV